MPVYLFTFHAYRSWMPDRPRGFVRRHEGVLPPDEELAGLYRAQAKQTLVVWGEAEQRALIDESLVAADRQDWRIHVVATENSHVHTLVSWRVEKPWQKVRIALKQSYSRRLNQDFGRRAWFAEGASRKQVADQEHFDRLVNVYLPSHSGWKWSEAKGYFQ